MNRPESKAPGSAHPRIVSLLPAATEILWFCGLGDHVVGVTYECAEPAIAAALPHVTDTIIPLGATPPEIDAIIRQAVEGGQELYVLHRELLQQLDPTLIISQDLCRVCALPGATLEEAVESLGCSAEVLQFNPMTLDDVLAGIEVIGASGGASELAAQKVEGLRARLDSVESSHAETEAPKVLLLEWTDPPFGPGHWIPDQITAAGGNPVLANPGGRSSALQWDEVASCEAEVLLVAPCGFDGEAAQQQLADVLARPELAKLPAIRNGRCHALDGDALIVRPGPRLVDGVELMASLFS